MINSFRWFVYLLSVIFFGCSIAPAAATAPTEQDAAIDARAFTVITCDTKFYLFADNEWATWTTTLDTSGTLTSTVRPLDAAGNVTSIVTVHGPCAAGDCTVNLTIAGDPNTYAITLAASRKYVDLVQPYPGLIHGYTDEIRCTQ